MKVEPSLSTLHLNLLIMFYPYSVGCRLAALEENHNLILAIIGGDVNFAFVKFMFFFLGFYFADASLLDNPLQAHY